MGRKEREKRTSAEQLADLVLAVDEGLDGADRIEEFDEVLVDADDWQRLVELATKAGGDARRGYEVQPKGRAQ